MAHQVVWEPEVAARVTEMCQDSRSTPLMVGVVGIPGAGKTSSCRRLAQMLPGSLVLPVDGYHLPLSRLRAMTNPDDMVYRRGAPETFDPQSLRLALEKIRNGSEETVTLPGFDHAIGDPCPDQHCFHRSEHSIVIAEGLYLLLDQAGWNGIRELFDLTVFVDSDVDLCVSALKIRNRWIFIPSLVLIPSQTGVFLDTPLKRWMCVVTQWTE